MQLSEQLARAFAAMGRLLNEDQGHEVLSRPDFAVLIRLPRAEEVAAGVEGVRPRDLARTEGLDPSTMSRRLASLTARGLIHREPDPDDGRAQVLSLTEEGGRAVARERARRVALVTDALDGWGEEESAELARLLGRLTDTLEASRPTS